MCYVCPLAGQPRFHFFNTFFYNKLYSDTNCYNYEAVKRWTGTRVLGYDVLACDKVFVPIHQGVHWTHVEIDITNKALHFLDSMDGNDKGALVGTVTQTVPEDRASIVRIRSAGAVGVMNVPAGRPPTTALGSRLLTGAPRRCDAE